MKQRQCYYPCTDERAMCASCREALNIHRLRRTTPTAFTRAFWKRKRMEQQRQMERDFDALCEGAYQRPFSIFDPKPAPADAPQEK